GIVDGSLLAQTRNRCVHRLRVVAFAREPLAHLGLGQLTPRQHFQTIGVGGHRGWPRALSSAIQLITTTNDVSGCVAEGSVIGSFTNRNRRSSGAMSNPRRSRPSAVL